MESLEELLSGCVGGFLLLGIELTILVGIEPFEELGAFVAFFLAGLGEEPWVGVNEGEGEQAKGERATIG